MRIDRASGCLQSCPPIALALLLVYVPSFFRSWREAEESGDVEVVIKENIRLKTTDDNRSELDVQATVHARREPRVLRTLLTGAPSPASRPWSWTTFGINLALLAMCLDLTLRAHVFYPSHGLSFGRVGYVAENSARLLVREPAAFNVTVQYRPVDTEAWMTPDARTMLALAQLTDESDYTAPVTLAPLQPDTAYEYRIQTSARNQTGTFATPPRVGQLSSKGDGKGKFTFLHSSCILPRFPYTPLQHALHVPGFAHLAKWLAELRPYFMLFLGDFIYVDVPQRLGRSAEDYRREYRHVYASPDWPSVSADLPWLHVLDDHEIQNDWKDNTTGVAQPAYDAFRHYHVAANPPAAGPSSADDERGSTTYFSFTQGPAAFFLLDTRRFRSLERQTLLGDAQLAALLAWVRAPAPAGVHWKFVVSSVPLTKNWRFGAADLWAGFPAERRALLEAMWDAATASLVGSRRGAAGPVRFVVLSGDRHEFAATAFPPPEAGREAASASRWAPDATVVEFSTSPLSMFYLPFRTYREGRAASAAAHLSPNASAILDASDDVCLKYLPDGNAKFGAVEISAPPLADQSLLTYRLFVDGAEVWSHVLSTPTVRGGRGARGRAADAVWG